MMLNAHKQRGAKLYGNTGCYILLSGVLCVLFYIDILPFIFFFLFVLFMVSSVWPHLDSWELSSCTTNKMLCGYFVACLSIMTFLEWNLSKQHQGCETGGLNAAQGGKKWCFIHSQCWVNRFYRIRMLPASAMPGAIFMDKASLAQIPC